LRLTVLMAGCVYEGMRTEPSSLPEASVGGVEPQPVSDRLQRVPVGEWKA